MGRASHYENPFELDFRPMTAEDVRTYRTLQWSTFVERLRHPRWLCSYPSLPDMATRIGVHVRCWESWERDGVSGAWAALLRLHRDERRDVSPVDAGVDELELLMPLAGNWSELARWLDVDRRTITKWREGGVVPGRYGYGRVVKICYEDMIG